MRFSCWFAWTTAAWSAVMLVGNAGCTSPSGGGDRAGLRPTGQAASRLLRSADLTAVRPVAERVFRQHFRIDPAASTPSVLVSRPQELGPQEQPERIRDVLRPSANRHRQLAELQLLQEGPDVRIRCRVETQRLDTTERATFAGTRGDDRPTETPIDRYGAASSDPHQEWVSVGRDKNLEQEILAAIQRELAGATQPGG